MASRNAARRSSGMGRERGKKVCEAVYLFGDQCRGRVARKKGWNAGPSWYKRDGTGEKKKAGSQRANDKRRANTQKRSGTSGDPAKKEENGKSKTYEVRVRNRGKGTAAGSAKREHRGQKKSNRQNNRPINLTNLGPEGIRTEGESGPRELTGGGGPRKGKQKEERDLKKLTN